MRKILLDFCLSKVIDPCSVYRLLIEYSWHTFVDRLYIRAGISGFLSELERVNYVPATNAWLIFEFFFFRILYSPSRRN